MNLRNKLAVLFSPTRRLTGDEAALVQQGGLLGGQEKVVPRAECQYRRLDLTAMPARQRSAAARLAVSRYEPSPDAATHVAWTGGIAHLWIWATQAPATGRREQRWIPETLLAAPPVADGPRLLAMNPGVEGQLWQSGQLLTSQWWSQAPDQEAWQRFLRGAGLDPETASFPPQPVVLPWSASPWGERQQGGFASSAVDEYFLWMAALVLLALALGWQVAGLVRWNNASKALASQLEVARKVAAPLLAARERAEQLQVDTAHLLQLQSDSGDYELMGEIIAALPEGAQMKAWQRNADKLQVTLQSAETDPRKFVSAFEKLPRLADVTATPVAGGTMQLAFTLPGKSKDAEAAGGEK